MKLDPKKMTQKEVNVFLVTEMSNLKENCVTDGKVYGILLKCLIGITTLGGLILAGIKLIPVIPGIVAAAIASIV